MNQIFLFLESELCLTITLTKITLLWSPILVIHVGRCLIAESTYYCEANTTYVASYPYLLFFWGCVGVVDRISDV